MPQPQKTHRALNLNDGMIAALKAGVKTAHSFPVSVPRWGEPGTMEDDAHYGVVAVATATGCQSKIHCPYGVAGNTIWVRECWTHKWDAKNEKWFDPPEYLYRADGLDAVHVDDHAKSPWISASHMPERASRFRLRITRVELREPGAFTDADAVAEGIRVADGLEKLEGIGPLLNPRSRWEVYWNTIYKVARWEHPDTRIWTVHFEGMT